MGDLGEASTVRDCPELTNTYLQAVDSAPPCDLFPQLAAEENLFVSSLPGSQQNSMWRTPKQRLLPDRCGL
jgi:hypothetical protein